MDEIQRLYKQTRATFLDTFKAQEKLRVELDRLEKQNISVESDKRKDFFEFLAKAMLGLDYDKKCILRLPDTSGIDIDNVGEFIRFLAYHEDSNIDFEFLKRYGKREKLNIPISWLWHEIKFVIFGIYPEALAMSIRISKEIIEDKRPVSLIKTVRE